MSKEQTLLVIIPALNEERSIRAAVESVLAAMRAMKITGEIILINDGSTDGTPTIIEELKAKEQSISCIHHPTPRGVGRSFWEGVQLAKMEVVTIVPGDNENDPREIFSYLDLMSEVDMVVPFIYNVEVRSRVRRIISSIYRMIINISFGTTLNYTNGAVLYRRCILSDVSLKSIGFFYQAELLVKLIRQGYLFAEVPRFLSSRGGGESKATTLKSLFKVIAGYSQLVFEIHIARSAGCKVGHSFHHLSRTSYKLSNKVG